MGDWMQWLKGINTGAPGGPMGAGGLPQAGGMPAPGQPMGGGGMPPPPGGQPPPGSMGPGPQPMPAGGGMKMPGAGGPPPGGGLGAGIGASLPPVQPGPQQPQRGGMNASDAAQADLYTTLAGMQPEEARIKRQRAMADQLRSAGSKMPQMRDPTVASHPLEFLSSLAHTGLGAYQGSQADAAEKKYGDDRLKALMDFRGRQGL